MKIRLSDVDAERLGVAPVLEFDDSRMSSLEAIAMSKATGWSVVRLGHALQGHVLRDDNGPVFHRDPLGELVRDEAGNPSPVMDIPTEALVICTWLAVRRGGVDVAWKDFDVNLAAVDFGDEDEAEPGKAQRSGSTKRATSKT